MKIMMITAQYWPGANTALRSIQQLISELYPSIETTFLSITDPKMGFGPIQMIKDRNPEIIIISGFDNNMKMLAMNASPRAKKVVMWCSPILQSSLCVSEPLLLNDIMTNPFITNIGWPLESDYLAMKSVCDKTLLMPIYMNVDDVLKHKIDILPHDKFNISMFCAPCSRKNIMVQMLALSRLKDQIILHTNYNEQGDSKFYVDFGRKVLGSSYVNHKWSDKNEYFKTIQNMDLCMQVSLSESFNYVAAEHMAFGIPALVSRCIPFSGAMKDMGLVVEDNQSIEEIYDKVNGIVDGTNWLAFNSDKCNLIIRDFCAESKIKLSETIKGLVGV